MWKIKNRSCVLLLLLALCFLPALCGSSVQAEAMYQISEGELTQLETNLNQLAKNNESKEKLLTKQETQLTEAQNQLKIVNEQLQKSRDLNEATQKSLQTASESFKKYETEAEHKIRVKTRQRNLWIVISAIFGTIAITK